MFDGAGSPDHAVVRLLGPSMLSLQAVFFSGGCEGPVNDCPQTIATDDNRSVAADLVAEATEAQERFDRAQTKDEQDRARRELESIESFLNIASDIIQRMGIAY